MEKLSTFTKVHQKFLSDVIEIVLFTYRSCMKVPEYIGSQNLQRYFGRKDKLNNCYPWDPKIIAVIDSWSLFRGTIMVYKFNMRLQNGDRYRQVVSIQMRLLAQV